MHLSDSNESTKRRTPMKTKLFILLLFVCVFSANIVIAAGNHPNVFLNQAEIDAIKLKVSLNEEPWKQAYDRVIERAEDALNKDLQSVTFQGIVFGSIQWHQEDDHSAGIIMSDSVRTLGLAYAFTGDSRYAEKAIDFIWTWALDPVTRMRPTPPGKTIQIYVTMPALFYGADLISGYEGWDPAEKASFESWTQTIANYIRNRGEGDNNFSNWRTVMLASAGAFLNDQSLLDYAANEWKRLLSFQMSDSGSDVAGMMGQEVTREDGLHYSLFAINAMMQTAEILHSRGVNLYDYVHTFANGTTTSLKLGLDFITPYAINPELWGVFGDVTYGYTQITPIAQRHHMAIYEMAYSYYQEQQFLDAIIRWVRPMYENRIMGITTLTHGNTFELGFDSVPPTIITQSTSQSVTEGESVTFSVTAVGSAQLNFQWFRNNVVIPGATNNNYTIEQVLAIDNNRVFYCEINNDFGTAISNNVVLTVNLDTIAPVIDVAIVQSPVQVDIRFNEVVTPASAQLIANYQISGGIQVIAASLNSDGKTVQLQTDNLVTDTVYTVTINNIQDTSSNANQILPDSSIDIQFAPIMSFDNGLLPFEWIPLTLSRWSVVDDNGNNALFLNTTTYNPLSGDRLGEHIISPDSYGDFTLTVEAKINEGSGNANADYALVFGFENENNYYYMLFNRTQSNTQLFKVINGIRQELATATASIIDDEYHTVEVRRITDNITVKFDNNIVLQITDSSLPIGRLGVGSYNDSAYFDDIRIVAPSSGLSALIFADEFE